MKLIIIGQKFGAYKEGHGLGNLKVKDENPLKDVLGTIRKWFGHLFRLLLVICSGLRRVLLGKCSHPFR